MKFVENLFKNHIYIILILTVIAVMPKWIFSFIYFDESISLRVINEISDTAYLPLIKTFSEFNLNPSYSENLTNLNIISFPFLGLFINSIFFKIFGSYSFIILEFLCVYLFLYIFYNIFTAIKHDKFSSILFSFIIFSSTLIIKDLTFFEYDIINKIYLNFQTFYTLRFPRPIISNLFLFAYIFFIIKFYLNNNFDSKKVLLLTLIMSFTMHVFFYLFIFQFFLIFLIYIFKFKKNILIIISENIKKHIFFFLILLISYSLLRLQMSYSEPDYLERIGIFTLDNYQKNILLKYLINFFLRIEFLLLFVVNTLIYIFYRNKLINVFYYLFLSTIISTTFFILFYNNAIDYYHFFNWILTSGLLTIIASLLILFNKIINKYKTINIVLLSFLLFYYFFSNVSNQLRSYEHINKDRVSLNKITLFFKNNPDLIDPNYEILNLNYKLSLWLILNNYQNFSIIPVSFWTPKKTSQIEDELISSFKLVDLPENDFLKFISNSKKKNRYKNPMVQQLFDRTYLANQLKKFDDKNLYTDDEKLHISKSSPLISHQLIIPENEIKRLQLKFQKNIININPKIIVFDNYNAIFNNNKINLNNYCSIYSSDNYNVYVDKKITNQC